MVNKPLIRPYFWGTGMVGGGPRLTIAMMVVNPRNLLKFIGASVFALGHALQCIHKGNCETWQLVGVGISVRAVAYARS